MSYDGGQDAAGQPTLLFGSRKTGLFHEPAVLSDLALRRFQFCFRADSGMPP